MSQRFANKYALVTGGSKGIGQAICVKLATEGAHVCIHFNSDSAGAETTAQLIKEALAQQGVHEERTLLLKADLSQPTEVPTLFERYFQTWARLDVCVPNAGIQMQKPFDATPLSEFDLVMNVNLKAYVLCAQEAIKRFLVQGGGAIVFDSSVHQIIPKPEYTSYAVSKAAIGGLTRTLALEYADRNIRVNCVGPGATETPMNAGWVHNEKRRSDVTAHIPMGRAAKPEEIASVFAFLASDDASYITGQTLYACGGLTLYPEFKSSWSS
eukprot:NODE_3523_length_951_cov_31.324029_g3371_i0.p1 GENE.NODE_3523_length_951_cov_31.324029_g3371_i0~~NODE_3523_length_951_cov_31.324029_g3371_i0.p1  ORF type:complete len:288 (-),score=49.79 NODE_3523_length_951_cov_31.324029_g3371_i0:88-894(-)